MALPKILYVKEENPRDKEDRFLNSSEDASALDEGMLGIYTLTGTVHMRRQVQFRRPKAKEWYAEAQKEE